MTPKSVLFILQTLFISGTLSACPEINIESSFEGGYKAQFSGTSPVGGHGLWVDLGFDHEVDSLEVEHLDIVYQDSTHFTLSNTGWDLQPGYSVDFGMTVHYSGEQPNLNGVKINARITCGGDGNLNCDGTGTSPYDYKQALCMSYLFYEAQRSGYLPFEQRVRWRWDSAGGDGSDVGIELSGGWYDAGDHVKFGFPMAYTATVLSWGIILYEQGYTKAGQLDHARNGVKWATDYFLKCHSGGSTLYGQLGNGEADHAYWGRPEEMPMYRPAYKIDAGAPGSDLAGETAAALAAASIVFKDIDPDYSAKCLDAAKDLFSFADEHRRLYHESITDAVNFYKSWSGYGDELGWSAIWMYKATGDSHYMDKARGFHSEFDLGNGAEQFDWDSKKPGYLALMAEHGTDDDKRTFEGWTDHIRYDKPMSPGGMVYMDQWGTLRHAANVAFLLYRAANMGLKTSENKDFAMQQLHYILGSQGRSFVVGFGNNPPQKPHHRSSSCPDPPASCTDGWAANQGGPNPQTLYGALVGGPDQWDNYNDDRMDFVHNEVACDYNAGFTGLLAGVVESL